MKGPKMENIIITNIDIDLNGGYVKLFRKLLKSRVFAVSDLLKVWIFCLLRACHSDQIVNVKTGRGFTVVNLKPGDLIFGRDTASDALQMPPSSVRNRIRKLELMGNITIKKDTHYSIISITNWSLYQSDLRPGNRTTKGQLRDTYKIDKNEKKDDIDQLFERFWSEYPKKVGREPAQIVFEIIFKKLTKDKQLELFEIIKASLTRFKNSAQWQKENGRFILNPTKWLKEERWEDEIETTEKHQSEAEKQWKGIK